MNIYNRGLEFLLENSPKFKISDSEIGIVTATDHNTFAGVKTLFTSIKDKINFICYDIGMSSADLTWCNENGLNVIKFEIDIPLIDKWQTYLKPFIVQKSPFNYTLWIDSDCIVVGDLSKSSIITEKRTFFSKHWISKRYLRTNNKRLYELFPVEGNAEFINAGVFGINKSTDNNIIDEWVNLMEKAIKNKNIRDLIVNWDEGGLVWSLQKTNKGRLVVDENSVYNMHTEFVGSTSCPQEINIKSFYERPTLLLPRCSYPSLFFKTLLSASSAYICHFSTCMQNNKKYWNMWS